jgi:iron(II)-dependent oxidoreductase
VHVHVHLACARARACAYVHVHVHVHVHMCMCMCMQQGFDPTCTQARAYCAWAHGGARLPHEWEWQYAAQGTDGRPYPWGASKVAANYPPLSTGTTCHGPQPVAAHAPQGDSPFGVSDMVGNVWQYTDEVRDEHTRAVILRGGSNYHPSGSSWYFPNQIELSTHNKYFLFSDRYERAATIGVRCVKDVA